MIKSIVIFMGISLSIIGIIICLDKMISELKNGYKDDDNHKK